MKPDQAKGENLIALVGDEACAPVTLQPVFIERNVFDYFEPFITQAWPTYGGAFRRREYRIPVAVWQEILQQLRHFRVALLDAQTPDDVSGFGFVMPELRTQARQGFARIQQGLVALITEVEAWLEAAFESYKYVKVVEI